MSFRAIGMSNFPSALANSRMRDGHRFCDMNGMGRSGFRSVPCIVALLVFSLVIGASRAVTETGQREAYWVSPTGTASWVDARSDRPLAGTACTSLSAANANASPGDTVYLRGGTYAASISPAHSGTADRRITFQAHSGEMPVFAVDTETKGRWAIRLDGRSYIRILGIASRGSLAFFWIGYGSCYNEIAHCTFDRSSYLYSLGLISFYGTGLRGEGLGSDHNWLHHNVFSRYGGISDGNDLGTVRISGSKSDPSAHNTFEENVFFYGGHDNLDVGGRYNVVRNNIFHNEEAYYRDTTGSSENRPQSGYFGNRCIHVSNAGDGPGTAYHTLIEGNRIGYAGTPPDDDGSCGIENAGAHTIARYNDIYGNGGMGFYSKMQASYESPIRSGSWARVYNNTIYHNGFGDPSIDTQFKHGICIWSYRSHDDWPQDIVIKNNIVSDNYNEWRVGSDNILPQIVYANNFDGRPGFVNPDMTDKLSQVLPDLRIGRGSRCIDKGIPLTEAKEPGVVSRRLVVADPLFFQDGTWGSALSEVQPDWVAVGSVGNAVQIESIDYTQKVIHLTKPLSWRARAPVWLVRDSKGQQVLHGPAPDVGAHEYAGLGPER